MKNTINKKLNTLKPLIVAFVLLAGLVFVSAVSWTAPSASPKSSNTSAPLDEGSDNQEKLGELTVGAISNTGHGPVVTYSPLFVGWNDGVNTPQEAKTTFYGPLNLFNISNTSSTPAPICSDSSGKLKLCSQGVVFEAVNDTYYSTVNSVTFPSGGIVGYVKYKLDGGVTCTTSGALDANTNASTSSTNWPTNATLTNTNDNYAVTFSNWGSYKLPISCTNSKSYTVTINVKGLLRSTPGASIQSYQFPANRTLTITATGAGSSAVDYLSNKCLAGDDGGESFVKINSSSTFTGATNSHTDLYAYGGIAPINVGGACNNMNEGEGGKIYINSGTVLTQKNGYNATGSGYVGSTYYPYDNIPGCSGLGSTCGSNDYGRGGNGDMAGGGGGYGVISKAINQSQYIHIYSGLGGNDPQNKYKGKNGIVTVEW